MESAVDDRLKTELKSVQDKWHGGYHEGFPLDPIAPSAYAQLGYINMLYATYLCCIKPYVTRETVALEIGPGRGCWTKCLLPAKQIYALDALSAQHNCFFEYLGHPTNVKYFQVDDFECEMLPDDGIDYMFSHGTLCHVSFSGITRYAERIYPKMKSGGHCFWMVADAAKHNDAHLRHNIWDSIVRVMPPQAQPLIAQLKQISSPVQRIPPEQADQPKPGIWYAAGGARTCAMLQQVGYEIVDPDVGTNPRDVIIHFRKP